MNRTLRLILLLLIIAIPVLLFVIDSQKALKSAESNTNPQKFEKVDRAMYTNKSQTRS